MFDLGSSFDVASMPEFMLVYENAKGMPDKERYNWVWDKVIYANTIKPTDTLKALNMYKPLVTFDNELELHKIKAHAPDAGLVVRLKVPNVGCVVELSSKFGAEPEEATRLIVEAFNNGLNVEGVSFHVGSQSTTFDNYVNALKIASDVMKESEAKTGKPIKILDIGGGFPARYKDEDLPFKEVARKVNTEIDRLFQPDIDIIAEPGRYMVANACTLVCEVIGKDTKNGRQCLYIDDGVYNTLSGQLFDHVQYPVYAFKEGKETITTVFGPTCDALDTITKDAMLPSLDIGDRVFFKDIGAYSNASSTRFNGFPPAKVVYVNA
jgi:ornithine decarboxylase